MFGKIVYTNAGHALFNSFRFLDCTPLEDVVYHRAMRMKTHDAVSARNRINSSDCTVSQRRIVVVWIWNMYIYIHMYTFSRNTSGFAGLHVEFPRGRNAASKQGKWSLIDNSYPPYGERLIPLCTTSARLRLRNLNLYPFLCLLFWLVNIWTVRPSRVFSYFRIICRVAVRTRQYTFPRDDDDDTDLENIHWNIHCIFAEPISTTIVSTSHT